MATHFKYEFEVYTSGFKDADFHIEGQSPPPSIHYGDEIELSTAGGASSEKVRGRVNGVKHFMCGTENEFVFQTRIYVKRAED